MKKMLDAFQELYVCAWEVIITWFKSEFYWTGLSGGLKSLHPLPDDNWLVFLPLKIVRIVFVAISNLVARATLASYTAGLQKEWNMKRQKQRRS